MFAPLLAIHSLLRWVIVIILLYAIVLAFRGWILNKPYNYINTWIHTSTAILVSIQLMIGLWLYFNSPIVSSFLNNFSVAISQRQLRFFGMEHSLMMLLGVGSTLMGTFLAHKEKNSRLKFKLIAIWYSIAFIAIFPSIPWAFSPFTARPYFRLF